MKKILIIHNEFKLAQTYKNLLDIQENNITALNYNFSLEDGGISQERYNDEYDLVIMGGLLGDCFELYTKLKSERIIITSGNEDIREKCKEKRIENYTNEIKEVMEAILR